MMNMKKWAMWLVWVGGLNWGLTAFNFNLVKMLADLVKLPIIETIVYIAVGASALYLTKDMLKK